MNVIEFLLIESKTSSCINNSNVARSWKGFDHILISKFLTFWESPFGEHFSNNSTQCIAKLQFHNTSWYHLGLGSLQGTLCPDHPDHSECPNKDIYRPPAGRGAGQDSAGEEQGAGALPQAPAVSHWRPEHGNRGETGSCQQCLNCTHTIGIVCTSRIHFKLSSVAPSVKKLGFQRKIINCIYKHAGKNPHKNGHKVLLILNWLIIKLPNMKLFQSNCNLIVPADILMILFLSGWQNCHSAPLFSLLSNFTPRDNVVFTSKLSV